MTVPKSWHKVCQKTLSRANSCHIREKNGGIAMFAGRSDVLMNYSELELSEVLYDGLVGGALGLIGSGVEVVQNRNGTETPNVDAGARQAEVEGNFTPEVESSAEGAQSAPAADNQGNGLVGRMRDSLSVLRDEQRSRASRAQRSRSAARSSSACRLLQTRSATRSTARALATCSFPRAESKTA